jgi:two-component system sensor histidine kinase KdpD
MEVTFRTLPLVRAYPPLRKTLLGCAAGLGVLALASLVMLAFRSHLSAATVGLVLVLPVIAAVIAGGVLAGLATVAASVLVYDLLFIPPYGSFTISQPENWVALTVYVVVMTLVSHLTSELRRAEAVADSRTAEAERLFMLSELLVGERPLSELLELIAATVHDALPVTSVVLLMPVGGSLAPVALAGDPLSEESLAAVVPAGGVLASLAGRQQGPGAGESTSNLVLSASGRPVGLLALVGMHPPLPRRDVLATFANHVALALERAQLREQAVRMTVLEEVDGLRRSLIGTVSHDLRTPLATIKTSSSALLDSDHPLRAGESRELLELIDSQTDRLTRLVSNLLDMSRIQSGQLVPRLVPIEARDLALEAVATLDPVSAARVRIDIPDDLPQLDVDHVFITEALLNLLENALRHAPPSTPVVLDASANGTSVTLRVTDQGPGIPPDEREHVFERAALRARTEPGGPQGGTGVGLTIVKAFVEAHGGTVRVEDASGGGARFCIDLPVATRKAPDRAAR